MGLAPEQGRPEPEIQLGYDLRSGASLTIPLKRLDGFRDAVLRIACCHHRRIEMPVWSEALFQSLVSPVAERDLLHMEGAIERGRQLDVVGIEPFCEGLVAGCPLQVGREAIGGQCSGQGGQGIVVS